MRKEDFELAIKILCQLIRRFEGCKLMPYFCPAGILTCGWGSTGPDVVMGKAWTQEYADMRLRNDAIKFLEAVMQLCPGLTINQLAAISDFAYNLGVGRLKASTLRKVINNKQYTLVAKELHKWIYGGGRILKGLVIRRDVEATLFNS
jgi:lysozyme